MTEGHGCVNDFSRTLAQTIWEPLIPKDAITVFSGGTKGVLSPHITFVVRSNDATGPVAAVGRTRNLMPADIGTATLATLVAETVDSMTRDLKVQPADAHLVLVTSPLPTSGKIASIRAAGKEPVMADTYKSMALARSASALGVASTMGELARTDIESALLSGTAWSAKASCSSGPELEDNHILILAADPEDISESTSSPNLRITSDSMADTIDASIVQELLPRVKKDNVRIVQLFAKAEADSHGLIRGARHTMSTDSDSQSTRHA
ncbi:hypothetical protein LTR53_015962 [Teratosphaeriaceae sp. CCFEE 6253]|nr:hypothetical protein LTR53_015962 [Teratosphaeriaceae sp. CCFEE 6253]